MPRSRERDLAYQATRPNRRRLRMPAPDARGRRLPLGTAGFISFPPIPMAGTSVAIDPRHARMQAFIEANQPIRVLPRWLTNRMLKRWYQERPASKSSVPGNFYDRTVVVLFLIGLIANALIQR